MFKLPDGIKVANLRDIEEGYDENKIGQGLCVFRVNVSAENIPGYFTHIISQMGQPGFFLIELPVPEAKEIELRKDKTEPFHKEVYYLDGISVGRAREIFSRHERLLVHDGMMNFGYGYQRDEIYVGPYKLFHIHTDEPERYKKVLSNLGIPRREYLKVLMDNIGPNSPGRREVLKEQPSIWNMLEELKRLGFYLAETRED